ncbi:MAG TPA: FeoA family protein [Verrucomicrobiae bacterium]
MESKRCELCPLNRVKVGVAVRVRQLTANPDVAHRLREIGLGEDQVVRLLTAGVNVICLVCNARLALSYELAQRILVEPITAGAVQLALHD